MKKILPLLLILLLSACVSIDNSLSKEADGNEEIGVLFEEDLAYGYYGLLSREGIVIVDNWERFEDLKTVFSIANQNLLKKDFFETHNLIFIRNYLSDENSFINLRDVLVSGKSLKITFNYPHSQSNGSARFNFQAISVCKTSFEKFETMEVYYFNPEFEETIRLEYTKNFSETYDGIQSFTIRRDYGEKESDIFIVISKKEDWVDYCETFGKRNDFTMIGSYTYREALNKYDESFFDNNIVVVYHVVSGSGSNVFQILGFRMEDDYNIIQVGAYYPEMGTCDMAAWDLVFEMSKDDYAFRPFKSEHNRIEYID